MKRLAIASTLIILAAGMSTAQAASNKNYGYYGKNYTVSKTDKHRMGKHRTFGSNLLKQKQIAISRIRLAQLKKRVRADGRVTFFEKRLVQAAEARHRALISNKRHR